VATAGPAIYTNSIELLDCGLSLTVGMEMNVSTWPPVKTIYALRACVALAGAEPGTRMKAGEIAMATSTPQVFLSKILGKLHAADIVSSKRGYHGGYRLTRAPEDIHVDELLAAVGTRDPFSSLLGADDAPVPFIDDLRSRLHALAVEALHSASLAELVASDARLKYDLTGQESTIC
jgi:Rrf2 family protein